MKKKYNIGVLSDQFINWGGGIDFIRLILNSLSSLEKGTENKINVFVFIPKQSKNKIRFKNNLKRFINLFRHKKYQLQRIILNESIEKSFLGIGDSFKIIFYNEGETSLIKEVLKLKIDIIIPTFSTLSPNFPIPWVGYLYDFQHKYYPSFFSKQDITLRNNQFSSMLNKADTIIVNSKSVKNDVNKFYGKEAFDKVFALPFCPILNVDFFKSNVDLKTYNLPEKYFMVSNQFWKHKDHVTAFKAFRLFLNSVDNKDVFLVCTGQTQDARFPDYFETLQGLLIDLNLSDNVLILGYIPKIDQLQILKNCIAIIQPTLFEGGPGGGAVFESVAYGVSSIVSDIAVNKEIEDETVTFFKTGSEIDLTKKMLSVFQKDKQEYSSEELVLKNNYSLLKMGEQILNIINKEKNIT
ncbi:glycosyltransferase [Polaribacter sp. PL03]|uniref:glycosyltransferase n=1 Tax=Polaribacter sp. PL03 TaxID=3088353 RepID=UPI0029D0F7AC|nr:glycosyltransferase [Polaribacter sp. PL03]MDX6747667.1 glycosyltransferase [Polaribacter sp. PL03]